jgi:hypothetical protein
VDVVFTPVAGPIVASGRTDASGKFVLTSLADKDGAPPGEYTVTVVPGVEALDEMPEGNEPALPKRLATATKVPAKYGSPGSGLSAKVTADGPNEFTFELMP